MAQVLNLTTIKKWIRDYRQNKQLVNETNSVTIDLEKIKEFISYIDEQNNQTQTASQTQQGSQSKINAVRFYLTRQNNISDVNVLYDKSINDNLDDRNNKLKIQQRRMTVFFDKDFQPQSQISLLAVPVLNYRQEYRPSNEYIERLNEFRQHTNKEDSWWVGEDYRPDTEQIHCLYARHYSSEHSGLCPYNCDGTEDGLG